MTTPAPPTPGDEHADLRERLARALYASDGGGSWDSHPHTHGRYRRQADALLPVVTAHTDVALADVWDEAAEATAEWVANNPGPSDVPHDPPRNPYREQ